MDDRNVNSKHRVIMLNREELSITGIIDVISFDEDMVMVETDMGVLEIKGNELHVHQLNLEIGEMSLTGEIVGLEYDDKASYKKGNASIISRLFG